MAAYNIYEAKTSLSRLVEQAAAGEEVIIAKAGKPMVKLVPVLTLKAPKKRRSGQNDLGITYIADDFDAPLPEDILKSFWLLMRYLLDSHVFLWYKDASSPLTRKDREHLDDLHHELWFSVASAWELMIKRSLGKLQFSGSIATAAQSSRIQVLPVQLSHALEVERIPRLHGDPFDHLLIAQARVEGLILVTHDEAITRYSVPVLRV